MSTNKDFTEDTLIDMMFSDENIESFKILWEQDNDPKKWSCLLHITYCEESYTSVGGDEGYLENPPIDYERLKYLEELIAFLEGLGITAT